MTGSLTVTICGYAFALAAWAAVAGVRGRALSRGLAASAVVLELAALLQLPLRLGAWASGSRPAEPAVACGYLAAMVAILPLAVGLPRASADGPAAGGAGDAGHTGDTAPATAFPLAIAGAAIAVAALRLRATWG